MKTLSKSDNSIDYARGKYLVIIAYFNLQKYHDRYVNLLLTEHIQFIE